MAQLNLDHLDDAYALRPEDDAILDYFLSDTNGAASLLDELTLGVTSAAIDLSLDPPTKLEFGYDSVESVATTPSYASHGSHASHASPYGHAASETASTTSAEYDAPDAPDSPTGAENELDTDEEKRKKRLERNRISARDSRARKKQYLELLKKKVAQLTEDIANARGEHLSSANGTLNTLKDKLLASLFDKISLYPPNLPLEADLDKELAEGVTQLAQHFGPNADERRAVLNYRFQQLDSLILPPYTRFLLWMSIQDEAFYTKTTAAAAANKKDAERKDSVAKKDGLWAALSTEMSLTYEQEEKIKAHYRASDSKTSKLERRKIALAVTYLHQLRLHLSERARVAQTHATKVSNVLTSEQSVRYQHWVSKNRDKFSAKLKEKRLQFASAKDNDPDGRISALLGKSDQALSVEDMTTLLSTLSKQHAAQTSSARP